MATEFRRVPLLAGQFVTVVTKKDGQTRMIVGPDPLEVTDDDIFAIPNKNDPTQLELLLDKEGNATAIQQFITLGPDEYAVVFNPVTSSGDFSSDYPNGKWQKGKNEVKPLRYGLKQMITRGSFPVWPGQKVEVRKIHHLSATQYLMIQVEEPVIEEGAPYYELVMQCASIKKALVDETIASETDETPIIAGDLSKANTAEGDGAIDVADSEKKEKTELEVKTSVLVVGQRIIIPGNLASTFIPPSGTDVVPVEKEAEEVPAVAEIDPDSVIQDSIRDGKLKMENLDSIFNTVGLSRGYNAVRETFVDLRENRQPANALLVALKKGLNFMQLSALADYLQKSEIVEKKKSVTDSVVREALVPGPTQYCVLIDENGDPETKKGPGRVWPGPNDHFRLEGSRDGIYDAYHIRVDRGLLLRVVATEITREELTKQLPLGSKLDKPIYHKGDEIFIGGFDAYFVPSKSVEVRNPLTRQLHIGNDHSEVYVPAIGVDQKSGVYIAKLATGNIALVKGEKSVLPDPRLERHIQRQISGSAFNLMIASQESHKRVDPSSLVTTPWAVSIMVPHNTAVLVTGKDNRRVVVGACRELLEYEEVLEVLNLTKGRPKVSGNPKVETCFLRIDGNRITDRVELETSDFVRVVVDVAYSVKFEGKNQEEMIKWFNFSNYVLFLCDNLRSRLRASARQMKLEDLYRDVSGFVRDTILGKKPEGEGKHRPGLLFEENNMMVKEVEILVIDLPDEEIKEQLEEVNRQTVATNLREIQRQVELTAKRNEEATEAELAKMKETAIVRQSALRIKELMTQFEVQQKSLENDWQIRLKKLTDEANASLKRANDSLEVAQLDVKYKAKLAEAELKIAEAKQQLDLRKQQELMAIEKELTTVIAGADVERLKAVQPRLIEAIKSLGNNQLAQALAENLPKAGGGLDRLLGIGGMDTLKQMVAGTPMGKALEDLGKMDADKE